MDIANNSIQHIPENMIRERTRIGNDWLWTQYVLAFEEWEFRVYNYEYEEYHNLDEWDRQYREDCSHYFYNFDYVLNPTSLKYTRLDIEGWVGEWVKETINDLLVWVVTYLDSDETSMDLRERITRLIKDNVEKMGTLVYQYYK